MQVLEELNNIFGPELKSVTSDPKGIDDVLCRVNSLILPIEGVSFNPFNICEMNRWKVVMQDFNSEVQVSLEFRKCVIDQNYNLVSMYLLACTNIIAPISVFCYYLSYQAELRPACVCSGY